MRTQIRDGMALAAYTVHRALGAQMDFRNPGGSWVTVWGKPIGGHQSLSLMGGETDRDEMGFLIARQTNFPPAAFLPGCEIRYPSGDDDRIYKVTDETPSNEDILQGATFKFDAFRFGTCTA